LKHLQARENVGLLMDGIAGIFAEQNKSSRNKTKNKKTPNNGGCQCTNNNNTCECGNNNNNDDVNYEYIYVQIKERIGVAKLALETGCNVIPGFGFGNIDVFKAMFDSYGILKWLSRKLKVSLLLFYGRYGLPIPFRETCYYVYGRVVENKHAKNPISNPTPEQIYELHARILQEFEFMFEVHKHIYGCPHAKLVFV